MGHKTWYLPDVPKLCRFEGELGGQAICGYIESIKEGEREEARWFAILAIKTGRSRLSLEGRVNAVFTCSPYHKFPADSRFAQSRMIAPPTGETKAGMRLITPSNI